MMYYDFEAGGKAYRLRISTRNMVALEKQLGCNPLMLLHTDGIPTITSMLQILHASLQDMHHGMSMDKVYGIWDDFIADGHTASDFLGVLVDVFRVSGLLSNDEVDEKN